MKKHRIKSIIIDKDNVYAQTCEGVIMFNKDKFDGCHIVLLPYVSYKHVLVENNDRYKIRLMDEDKDKDII